MMTVAIPKLFHWIWFGDKALPDQHRRWIDGWLTLHPDWDHCLWTDANRPTLTNEEQFLAARNWAMKADIARYEIVHRYGGVYVDTDCECLRSIDRLLAGVGAFVAAEKPDSLEQIGIGVIGASAGHPWLAELIARLPGAMKKGVGIREQTGPLFARLATVGRSDVTIFPERLFRHEAREPFEDTYAIHHGSQSWRDVEGAKYDATFREFLVEDIEPVVPAGATFIIVDKGRSHELSNGRRAIPFPERDGEWNGYPENDAVALAELERLRRNGAMFMVFPRPMFYWLDAYPGLRHVLQSEGRCVVNNDRVLIFGLPR